MACLNDFSKVENHLKTAKKPLVEALHKFVFEEEGDRRNRQRLRTFVGFDYDENDSNYLRKLEYIATNLTAADLTSICILLGLDFKVNDVKLHIFKNLCRNNLLKDSYLDENDDYDEDEDDDNQLARADTPKNNDENAENTMYIDANSRGCSSRGEGQPHDLRSIMSRRSLPAIEQQDAYSIRSNVDESRNDQRGKTPRFSLNFRDVEESVRTFDGENATIENWICEFEEMATLMCWDELQMLIFAKKCLKGLAKLFIMGEKGLTTWPILRSALLDEFSKKINSAQIHKMLIERKMKHNESIQEYFYHMKEIAVKGSIEDNALIQYIIDGIKDAHANKAMLYGATTLKEFKEKLHIYEVFSKKQKGQSEALTNKPKTDSEGSVDKKTSYTTSRNNNKPGLNCFNCGAKGHISSNCENKAKGPKCFQCNKYGHLARDCRNIKGESCSNNVRCISTEKRIDLMHIGVKIGDKNYIALFDTGCKVNIITSKLYSSLNTQLLRSNIMLKGFGHKQNTVQPMGKIQTDIEVDGLVFNLEFHVIPSGCFDEEVVIGYPICEQAEITINSTGIHIRKQEVMDIMHISLQEDDEIEIDIEETASESAKTYVKNLIENYTPNTTKTTNVVMKITLIDETPIASRSRRLPAIEQQIVDEQIEKWFEEGVIEESESEFSSPVLLVGKKDGGKRLCVDYRKINKVIVKDRFPLPRIEDQIDRLKDARIFSSIDLKNGFLHVPVDEASRKYTSFVTHTGQFQFCRVPFGLCNSPAVFQRHVHAIFRQMTRQCIALPYVDDIMIPAKTEEEAVRRLEDVLKQCQDYGLHINLKKCHFLKRKIEFLGHVIQNQTVAPSPAKKKVMLNYPVPKTLKQLESFLGLAGYFRKFIPDFAATARPLSDLTRKDQKFQMGEEQLKSFNFLKEKLNQSPVLKIFHQQHETELHTDASAEGYGAVLMQRSPDDGKMHPVHFMSRKTTDLERKYTSYELEILAVVIALEKFRVYLLGTKFTIITDCNAFAKTMDKKDLSTRVARWLIQLQEYDYKIEHRPAVKMKHVDALSRYPVMFVDAENMLTRLSRAQQQDESLKPIFEILKSKDEYNNFYIKANVLYKSSNDCELLVVPKAMEYEIIKKAHEKGHFSVQKTKNLIMNDYYVPKLEEKIQRCINCCIPCLLTNRKRGRQDGELHPIPKKEVPLHTYHVDYLGPLESTTKMYNHIFVVIDAFTKFCWLYPTKSTTSREVIVKLQLQSSIFGNPAVIISDRGTAFSSEEFRTYCEKEGIFHHKITTGLPRANGQVERLNSVIIAVLSKLSLEEPTKWYKHVAKVQQIINSTHHRSIDSTPFQILIGSKMRCEEDLKIKQILEDEMVKAYDEMRQHLRIQAKDHILKIQEENRHSYNLRRRPGISYKVGDTVAIRRTQFGGGLKLKAKYLGPYSVQAVKPNDTYDVKKIGNSEGPNQTTSCAEFMKLWPTAEPGTFGAKC